MAKKINAFTKSPCDSHKWESYKCYESASHYFRCAKCGRVKKAAIEK